MEAEYCEMLASRNRHQRGRKEPLGRSLKQGWILSQGYEDLAEPFTHRRHIDVSMGSWWAMMGMMV